MNCRTLCSAAAVLLAASILAPAAAEDADAGDAAPIEEIVVTGLRRAETVLETPAAISALGAEELRSKGVTDIADIQYLVPSLQYSVSLGERNVAIRGVGQFANAPGVMVSVDRVVQAVGSGSQLSQLDLERVEVLRGPQGTLYGRNATGGAVNFISAKPTETAEGYVRAGFAELDQVTVEGVYSGPVTDRVGIRVAANYLDASEGWVKNRYPGEEDLMQGEKSNLRLTLTAQVTDSLDAELIYGRTESSGPWDHWAMIREHYALGTASGLPPVDIQHSPPAPVLFTVKPREIYSRGRNDTDRQYELFSLTLDWDFEGFSIKSITGYQDWADEFIMPADGTSIGLFQRFDGARNETWTQELTIAGQNERLDWIAGMFYMDDERERLLFFDFPVPALLPLPVPIQLDIVEPYYRTDSRAVFVDATWSVSDRLRIGGGIRRTEEEKEEGHAFTILAKFPFGVVPVVQRCGPGILEQDWDESETTVRASVEYDLSETAMGYVSYSEGFKVGGVNQSDCNPQWLPETVDAYEAGYKLGFGAGASSLRVALFHYDYSDFQVAQVIGIMGVITNAGDAQIDGLELELTSALDERWTVNAGLTVLDSSYGHFLNTDTLRGELGLLQNDGNPLNNAPETSVNLGVSYATTLAAGGSLSVSLDASYRSRVYYREFGQKDDSQGAYAIVNVNANWRSTDGGWGARLFVRNLTDEEYVTQLVGSNTTYGRQGTWNMPRQAGVEVTKFFGRR